MGLKRRLVAGLALGCARPLRHWRAGCILRVVRHGHRIVIDLKRYFSLQLNAAQMQFLEEKARDNSKSPRAFAILVLLAAEAFSMPRDLDGRAAPIPRKLILYLLPAVSTEMSREALRKLLNTLQAARLVELNGSHVRISRCLFDDLKHFGASAHSSPALPCGASPAATPKGLPDGMPKVLPDGIPSYGNVYPAGWVSAELDAILKRLQATSGQ